MNNDWIEWTWTEEKPYPETLETYVEVMLVEEDKPWLGRVDEFWWDVDEITHYKLA